MITFIAFYELTEKQLLQLIEIYERFEESNKRRYRKMKWHDVLYDQLSAILAVNIHQIILSQ